MPHLLWRPTTSIETVYLIRMAKVDDLARTGDSRHAALIYNHQAVGIHPAVRVGSLLAKSAHPRKRVVRLPLHVYIPMGGSWWGSRKARRFGLAPVFQSRFVPAHPLCKRVSGDPRCTREVAP